MAQQDRAAILQKKLDDAREQAANDLRTRSSAKDSTDWLSLAPPGDDVTAGYLESSVDLRPLACSRSLLSAGEDKKTRGGLYPFQVGQQKTNGLLTAVGWMCDKYSASRSLFSLPFLEALNFVHDGLAGTPSLSTHFSRNSLAFPPKHTKLPCRLPRTPGGRTTRSSRMP